MNIEPGLAAEMHVSCMILEKKSMAPCKHLVTMSLTTRANSGTQHESEIADYQ